LLKSNQRRLDIFIDAITDTRIGYIRAEPFQSGQLLSWAVTPQLHGQGFGKLMLNRWCELATTPLWAQIKKENKASQSIAAHAQFLRVYEKDGIETWSRATAA